MWPRPPLRPGSASGVGNPGANEHLLHGAPHVFGTYFLHSNTQFFAFFVRIKNKRKMPSLDDIQNVFDGADLNENIDENVEEIELVISPINPEDFDFVEET